MEVEGGGDGLTKLLELDGLENIVSGSSLNSLDNSSEISGSRENDDGNLGWPLRQISRRLRLPLFAFNRGFYEYDKFRMNAGIFEQDLWLHPQPVVVTTS